MGRLCHLADPGLQLVDELMTRARQRTWRSALSARHSAILAMTSGFSKAISLGRDAVIIWALGFSAGADRVQIALATAGLLGGVGGSALGQSLLPAFLSRPLAERADLTRGLARVVIAFFLALVLWLATGIAIGSHAAPIWVGLVLGSLQAVSSLSVLTLQALEDVAKPAWMLSLDGLLTCALLGTLRLLGPVTYETVAVLILVDAAAISLVLIARLSWRSRHGAAASPSVLAQILLAPETRRRFAALGISFASTSAATVALRVVAARQPGGAAILAMAQRVGGVLAGLVIQPFQSLAYLALGRGEEGGVERVGSDFIRALVAATAWSGAVLAAAGALAPHWQLSGHRMSGLVATVVFVLLGLNFSNASALAVRDWLVKSELAAVVRSYLGYLAVVLLLLLTPNGSGAGFAALVELVALAVQAVIASRFSEVLRLTVAVPAKRWVILVLAASASGLALWWSGAGLLGLSLTLAALGLGTLWGDRRRGIRWAFASLWPSDQMLSWRSEVSHASPNLLEVPHAGSTLDGKVGE